MTKSPGAILDGAQHRPRRGEAQDEPSRIRRSTALAVVAAALALSMSAVRAAQGSPPGRTAQLSYVSGSVWLEPAGTHHWVAAELNRPMSIGDKIWADRDSRAELNIGDAVIRLWSMTGFTFLNLDRRTAQMQVTAGEAIVHVLSLADGEQDEIDTPNLALTLERRGIYRVEVSQSGDATIVEVVDGQAVASGGGKTYTVSAQQSVTFMGTTALTADYALLGAPDAFDDWSMSRDRQEAKALAAVDQYVSPDVVGADELAGYGNWQSTQWGYAWFPAVPAGWAPYSFGYWTWIFPWGWTWVDDEPWGFAPFHYGRWGWWNGDWCWVPGPRRVRPIYSPAMVAFTRGRIGRFGARAGARRIRPVGWLPLGPRDVYLPGYAASRAYVRDINLSNTTALNATVVNARYNAHRPRVIYANSRVPGAITVVPRSVFTTAQPVAAHRIILPRHGATSVRFTNAAPTVTPVRASVLGPGAAHTFSPPRRLIDRPAVVRLAPSRAPVPFAAQRAAIRANGGHPLSLGQWARLRPNRPAVPVRLAGFAARGAPGMAGGAMPVLPQRPAFEHAGVPSNRPPWLLREAPGAPAAVSAPPQRPAFAHPGVSGGRPPRVLGRPARPAGGHPVPPPAPRFEGFHPQRAPRLQTPPHYAAPPHYAPPVQEGSPPRFRQPPRLQSAPRFPAYHPGPPAWHAPAPRFHPGGPPPAIRRPLAFQSVLASPADQHRWRTPPMYRAQPLTAGPLPAAAPAVADNAYAPPTTPPPMYRPVGGFAGGMAHPQFASRPFAARAPQAPAASVSPWRPGPQPMRFHTLVRR